MNEDPRKTKLRKGLQQLTSGQILRLLEAPADSMVVDEYFYKDGKYWPLAVALEVPSKISEPTNESVRDMIIEMGYDINPMKGVLGSYYTDNRYRDLVLLAKETLSQWSEQSAEPWSLSPDRLQ